MKVLIAEDDLVSARLMMAMLERLGYEVTATEDGASALRALEQVDAPRLAVLDWMMPEMDGVEVCRRLRARKDHPYVYILLLTAKCQKGDIVGGLDAGADDYLTKPFDPPELKARLRAGERILLLQQQLMEARDTFRQQATHDFLTGLSNRAAICETLRNELLRARRQGSPVGVLLADLDGFKLINDTYGHLAGDAVLRETARRMRACLRPYDSIGRYGGEEFLAVVPGADSDIAAKQAERLRASIASEKFDTPDGSLAVTLSLGVAASGGGAEADPETLLRTADTALYRAKRAGRNRVELEEQKEAV